MYEYVIKVGTEGIYSSILTHCDTRYLGFESSKHKSKNVFKTIGGASRHIQKIGYTCTYYDDPTIFTIIKRNTAYSYIEYEEYDYLGNFIRKL